MSSRCGRAPATSFRSSVYQHRCPRAARSTCCQIPFVPASLTITLAQPSEADALTEIAFAAKRHWGYPEHWIEHWRSVLTVTPDFIVTHDTFVAREERRLLGFSALKLEGDLLWLEHLWIWPPAMRQGVGRALFRQTQSRARALGFTAFEVESDPHAAGFYERMGAELVRIHRTHFEGLPRELPVYRCQTSYELDRNT